MDMNAVPEEYQAIGWLYPSHRSKEELDLSTKELDDLLTPRGIIYGLDGLRAYRIIVPRTRVQEVRELVRSTEFKLAKVELNQ